LRKQLIKYLRIAKNAESDLQLIPTLDDLVAFVEAEASRREREARIDGAKTVDRIIRNSPDPQLGVRRYLQELERERK
jgi:hypothetical protein